MSALSETASQTAGPYVHIGCLPNQAGLGATYGGMDLGGEMIIGAARGRRIAVEGRVIDGAGAPLTDALVEIWQADDAGLFNSPVETRGTADPAFTGWGRRAADGQTGRFRFDTIKPGRVPWSDGRPQAPHIAVWIVTRGINLGLHTRVYFSDEAAANAEDPLLQQIGNPARVATLVAAADGDRYSIDLHLQGENETVFLDV